MKVHHSYHVQEPTKPSTDSAVYAKSHLSVPLSSIRDVHAKVQNLGNQGEYYKKYEHDEVPVKDSSSDNSSYLTPKNKGSLTNSELEKLEKRIFENVSDDLHTEDCCLSSLESNIKFFKSTVENIFNNFYTSMRDFEHYKNRFNEILVRSKDGSLDGMEDFITDMFDHIICSENLPACDVKQRSKDTPAFELEVKASSSSRDTYTVESNISTPFEAYKNDNYLIDSIDDSSAKEKSYNVQETKSVFLFRENPCVQINNDKNLISEKHREPIKTITCCIASADNMQKIAEKKLELERYVRWQDHNIPERDIPVRVSYAKKNIYLNEDFGCTDNGNNSKSLISKFCSSLCKKIRKIYFD